jgi:hypothetical protein
MAAHFALAETLSEVPATYDGATCVHNAVSPKEVRTFNSAKDSYSAEVPFPSPAADKMIGISSMSIVNLGANGLLTVLAVPAV